MVSDGAISPGEAEVLVDGVRLLGRRLRQWREFGSLASITARWETGDKTMVEITCDYGDRIWVHDPPGSEPIDVTAIVDA